MNQPELGKKIAELRKSKNLTQEDLVAKCNINVRTLQRIEAGEVMPRKYTLDLIFEALDYFENDSVIVDSPKRLEQVYLYIIDLFNLKTNTMKKIAILSVLLTVIIIGVTGLKTKTIAQDSNEDNSREFSVELTSEDITFSNFYCEGCFDDEGAMIGRDVNFSVNGVTIKASLIKLNRSTRIFNMGGIKGKLLNKKVELKVPRDLINNIEEVELTADETIKGDYEIVLKGNARLATPYHESIEAEEIVLIII